MSAFTTIAINAGNSFAVGSVCVGNLVRNGSFESGLQDWRAVNAKILPPQSAHSGFAALGMGVQHNNKPAILAQTICLPKTDQPLFLQLSFHLCGYRMHPAVLEATLTWLDMAFCPLGIGLSVYVPQWSIGMGKCGNWSYYSFITTQAPRNAVYAELRLVKLPSCDACNFLIIDDIQLIIIPAACYRPIPKQPSSLPDSLEQVKVESQLEPMLAAGYQSQPLGTDACDCYRPQPPCLFSSQTWSAYSWWMP